STTQAEIQVKLPRTMRTAPTSVDYSTLVMQNNAGGSLINVTNVTLASNANSRHMAVITVTVASGLTAGTTYLLKTNNSLSGYLGFPAEL
ncbi:hypothetical protein, partial [Salmonella enterica]|uniref:hypothetical protein n=1 Tax=Salmonella enterica TaxID=28901 RepID=UPI0035263A04